MNSELDHEKEGGLDEQWLTFKGTLQRISWELSTLRDSNKKKTTPWWGAARDAAKEKMK